MSNPFSKDIEFTKDLFIGRRRELWGTLERLANPLGRVSSNIYGETGLGRSWFLERIRQPDLLTEWEIQDPLSTVISLDCEGITHWSAEAFWQSIWIRLQAKSIPSPEQGVIYELLNTSASDYFLIGKLLSQIAENGRFLILLLDNFERAINGVDSDNPVFLNTLRSLLMREDKSLGIVLATAEPLHDLCKRIHFYVSPFDNVFYPVKLKRFDQAEAYDFIEVHLRDSDIRFTQEERQRLYQVSQGHPDRLREACFELFDEKSSKYNFSQSPEKKAAINDTIPTELEEVQPPSAQLPSEPTSRERLYSQIAGELQAFEENAESQRRSQPQPPAGIGGKLEPFEEGESPMSHHTQIFLSYASEDLESVEALYQELSKAGFKPWMDKKDILPGELWKSSISRAIRDSDFFVVCLSANSIDKRGWIQREIKQALDIWQEMLDSDSYLIPARLEECEVPESLRDFQWVDLFEEDGWTQLVKSIQHGMKLRS